MSDTTPEQQVQVEQWTLDHETWFTHRPWPQQPAVESLAAYLAGREAQQREDDAVRVDGFRIAESHLKRALAAAAAIAQLQARVLGEHERGRQQGLMEAEEICMGLIEPETNEDDDVDTAKNAGKRGCYEAIRTHAAKGPTK